MDIKMGGLLGGLIGVVGAAGTAFFAGDDLDETITSIANRAIGGAKQNIQKDQGEFCMISDAPFFAALEKGQCYSRSIISTLNKQDILDNQGGSVVVVLSSPPTAPEASDNCRTCNDYARMSRLGWFALSNRDQRREEFFRRACGMLDYLKKGEKAKTSFFVSSSLNIVDVENIEMESLPRLAVSAQLTEGTLQRDQASDAAIAQESKQDREELAPQLFEDGSWRVAMETSLGMQQLTIQPLSIADFDGDSVEDILVYVHAGIESGTAIGGSIGLLSKTSQEGEIYFVTN